MTRRPPSSDWKGHKDPREPCSSCDGEGYVEVMLPARHAAQESPDYETTSCDACSCTGVASCEECGADALRLFTVEGRTTGFFCSPVCQVESGVELDP